MASKGGLAAVIVLLAACARGGPNPVSDSDHGAYEASLAVLGHGFAVAWYDTRDGNAEIYLRMLDASGRSAGPERRLTWDAEASYEADIVALDRDVAVAWYGKAADGTLRPKVGRWSRSGERRWLTELGPSGRNPVVRRAGNRLFVAWVVDEERRSLVRGAWLGFDGALGAPVTLGEAGRTTWNLNAAVDGAGVPWVIFDARTGTRAEELFLVRADGSGAAPIRLTADDGWASKYPDLAFDGSRLAITWFDVRDGNEEVYLAAGTPGGLRLPLDASATRVTSSGGESIGAYLAWNDGRVGLAWAEALDGQQELFLQLFDATARPASAPRRLTRSAARSSIPAIESWGRRFAVAWNEYVPGDEGGHGDTAARSSVAVLLASP